MAMTVAELISILEDFDQNAEVRIAHQPRWAFEYSIGDVVEVKVGAAEADEIEQALASGDLTDEERAEAEGELTRARDEAHDVIYIAEGNQIGYLPGEASSELGWR